jgi:hypothetical protein
MGKNTIIWLSLLDVWRFGPFSAHGLPVNRVLGQLMYDEMKTVTWF